MCYAVQLAYDDASDPVYNNGWQAGDDGGTGVLGAWNFDGTYTSAPDPNEPGEVITVPNPGDQQAIDNGAGGGGTGSSPYNNIGRAWTIFNPDGPNQAGTPDNPPSGKTDISRVGRGITGNLQVGSTLKVVIDNPTERRFFRGWTLKLNHGGANQCYAGDNCSTPVYEPDPDGDPETDDADPDTFIRPRMAIGAFEYFTYGQWFMTDVPGPGDDPPAPGIPLYDKDGSGVTAGQVGTDSGLRIEFTLNTADTFTATMTPLDNPGAAFTHSGTLATDSDDDPSNGEDLLGLPLDWIQLEFYNTDSDFYPSIVPGNTPADYNGSKQVDASDYPVWRKFNGTGYDLLNEVASASPGSVTDADYDEWKKLYGSLVPRATDFYIRSIEIVGPGGSSGVPEPGTFVYLAAAATGLASLGWRGKRPEL
jgi:hypothetical protein